MITYIESDLFTSQAQTLVNTVNTVGVMGKGLAKRFKDIYPEMFEEYRRQCEDGSLAVGRLLLYRTPHKWVLNFPTKRHWRAPSRVDDIEVGLETFCRTYAEQGIVSAAFPQLGCGNGGLDWEQQVRPLMERHLDPLPIEVTIHVSTDSGTEYRLDQGQIADWLREDPPPLRFSEFQQDLVASVSSGNARNWSLIGPPEAPSIAGLGDDLVLDPDALFGLWHPLRSQGHLAPAEAATLLGVPAQPIFALFRTLPYVMPARVAHLTPDIAYDVLSTRAMLDRSEAQGVQFVPPLASERQGTPSSLKTEDDVSWSASQTTSQLALFSTG